MYTDPQIHNPKDVAQRSYILFYYNGKRCRYYNGKALNISCFPNNAKTYSERERLLKQLQREYSRALLKGWSPETKEAESLPKPKQPSFIELLHRVTKEIDNSSYSKTYKRDIRSVAEQFTQFLEKSKRENVLPNQVTSADVERFLQQFSSSGTYYQNKRRTFAALFSKLVNQGYCQSNPVFATTKRKAKAVLHQAYTTEQLSLVLPYLKKHYHNLFLCALLMYGTLLRPHQEIRLLKRKHFDEYFSRFILAGDENKGGRIRSLPVPEFVKQELLNRKIHELLPEQYIFTGNSLPFNDSYFNTVWSRAKVRMLQLELIGPNQTLYSFRHAASVNVFERSQNLKLLQQLLDHSSMTTTLTYLRSIGVIQLENSVMPELGLI
ncbi:tyrosine-type recombinase/integrase [Adhaeribacter radiodurans]|uniref:Tyrosine-type recombinase/integrase n=1 Tax=Adhaeribacter radiodurans TaxID=2745197 RepID=A0A7L7L5P1_9BACT|nr:tyrosine-type recombinase/integrase [Adhaeribacter radiodurans]QMU27699.1 tyrosine-type recombinase/integrase [Adhaeribacter radiodurans]